eukprot:EST45796.1 Thioredoxin-like domain-containing protein [Spironucleus salmonicida]
MTDVLIPFASEIQFKQSILQEKIKYAYLIKGQDQEFFEEIFTKYQGKVVIGYIKSDFNELQAHRESQIYHFGQQFIKENLIQFVEQHQNPHFSKLTPQNIESQLTIRTKLLCIFCFNLSDQAEKTIGKTVKQQIIQENIENTEISFDVQFFYADYRQFGEICKLASNDKPGLVILDQKATPYLKYSQQYENVNQIFAYIQQVVSGDIQGQKLFPQQDVELTDLKKQYVNFGKVGLLIMALIFAIKMILGRKHAQIQVQQEYQKDNSIEIKDIGSVE